jgi:hypothetical protein
LRKKSQQENEGGTGTEGKKKSNHQTKTQTPEGIQYVLETQVLTEKDNSIIIKEELKKH